LEKLIQVVWIMIFSENRFLLFRTML